jgi:hypothetical protein
VSEKRVRELAGRLLKSREVGDRDDNSQPSYSLLHCEARNEEPTIACASSLALVGMAASQRWLISDHRPRSAQVAAPLSAAGPGGLIEVSRAPPHQPGKTPPTSTAGRRLVRKKGRPDVAHENIEAV